MRKCKNPVQLNVAASISFAVRKVGASCSALMSTQSFLTMFYIVSSFRKSQQSEPRQRGCCCSKSLNPVSGCTSTGRCVTLHECTCLVTFMPLVGVCVCVWSPCVSSFVAACLLISCAEASSPGSVSFIHSKSAELWDWNPKPLGAVISCSLPSFKSYRHCAREQGTSPCSQKYCDTDLLPDHCVEELLRGDQVFFFFWSIFSCCPVR